MKKAKRKKSKTTKAIRSAKSAVRKTGAGLKRVAKKAARATGLACTLGADPKSHLVLLCRAAGAPLDLKVEGVQRPSTVAGCCRRAPLTS